MIYITGLLAQPSRTRVSDGGEQGSSETEAPCVNGSEGRGFGGLNDEKIYANRLLCSGIHSMYSVFDTSDFSV